jgi:uncharacterized membrane protein YkvA (DUF1232 family)
MRGRGRIAERGKLSPMSETPLSSLHIDRIVHPGERDRFIAMCTDATASDLHAMGPEIDRYEEHARTMSDAGRLVDVETAAAVAASLRHMLAATSDYTPSQRALLRGAIAYFVQDDDDELDLDSVIGFDDDARIVSAVAEALGRPDLTIDIGAD